MRAKIGSLTVAFSFFCLMAVASLNAQRPDAPVGGNLLPDGFYITPTAAPGSIFQGLPTGLRPDGSADANGAVNTALSPDGTALLISTTGYNTGFYTQAPNGSPIVWPALDPLTGLLSSTTTPNAEWVFVFDVRGAQPVQKQLINIPNTYHGLLWDPSGTRFYVAGGIDDRVEVFKNANTGSSADGNYVPDAPFVLLNHNQPADVPVQEYPTGGLFASTPINNSSVAQDMYMPFSALAAGLAISPDGTTLFVANYQNDSLSIVNTATRTVSNEIHFFVPGQTTAVGEMPYWPVVLSNANGGTGKNLCQQSAGRTSPLGQPVGIVQGHQGGRRTESNDPLRRSALALCFQWRS